MTLPKAAVLALVLAATVLFLEASTVLAAGPPSPDTLRGMLAMPPSGDYVEATPGATGILEGPFDAETYAKVEFASKQATVITQLSLAGFVTGYGRVWAKAGGGSILLEQILVFGDNRGANAEFGVSKLVDIANPAYKSPLDSSAIPNSYGINDLISGTYDAGVVWVKGNDVLVVVYVSTSAYPDSEAIAQAQKEDALAPAYTIQPPPQAAQPARPSSSTAIVLAAGIVLVLLVLIGAGIFLITRSRRASSKAPAAAGVLAGGETVVGPPWPISMSPDSRYWWDSTGWQDSMISAPAHAPRSPDGAYWWDGAAWHPVPRPR